VSKLQLDIRVGCVAVYRGPEVNCFSDLPKGRDLLYYGRGKHKMGITDNGGWMVPKYKILIAKIIYWWARRAKAEGRNETSSL